MTRLNRSAEPTTNHQLSVIGAGTAMKQPTAATASPTLGRASLLGGMLVAAMIALIAVVSAPVAHAAYGDHFGLAAINDGAGPAQEVPAMPEANHVWWAGTCDTATAPAPGDPSPIPGGIGAIPATITAPDYAGVSLPRSPIAASPLPPHCIDWGGPSIGNSALWDQIPEWRLPAHTQAGGHPDGTARFSFARDDNNEADGAVDNIYVDLPPGFVGDPTAVTKCTAEQFSVRPLLCPASSQVGVMHLELVGAYGGSNLTANRDESIYPIFNIEPRRGNVAELGFGYASGEKATTVRIVAKARTNSDFGVTTFVGQIPAALPVRAQQITLWGVPWASVNDRWRAATGYRGDLPGKPGTCPYQPGLISESFGGLNSYYIPPAGFTVAGCATSYDPSWGSVKPFISNLTECTGADLSTRFATDSFQHPGAFTAEQDPDLSDPDWKVYDSPAPGITGCEKNPFDPAATFTPTSTTADSASGLDVDIDIPQNDEPPAEIANDPDAAAAHWKSDAGVATAQLDKTVVMLPEGMSVNPSAASGLQGCSDAEVGLRQVGTPSLFNNSDPFDDQGAECPDGSVIGTVEATTPVLDEKLTGQIVLGTPKSTDPQSGEMFRLFLVLRNKERGLVAKVYGSTIADPATGRLTATFDDNPRVPVENIKVSLKGGQRGLLAQPRSCGERSTASEFTPWTAAHGGGGPVRDLADPFTVSGCTDAFAPALEAGMDTQAARSNGTFAFRFSRKDGEQYLRGLTATLPQGLLASVKDVPLCTNAQADAGACPVGSKIGLVDAKAGSGSPFVLEEKGEVFLTEGYKGGEYGLAVKIRPIAGPFRGAMELSPIMVRQAIHVDRKTAQVSAVSDPFPLIHHGVPLRVRDVAVLVNRAGFMLNPSDCATKRVGADISSDQGATLNTGNAFQAAGCSGLAFKPKLTLALTGRKQVKTGKHPGIKAVVTQQGVPEAGIEKAEVRLPKSLALDVDNAQALCEFVDGTKPDIENHCPKGSIVGRARAVSPLLNDPLVGNVYFVKNVRVDPKTGNQIRTLPMIVVALRGEISVNLKGESDTTRAGKLVNTFDQVPDAPVSQFNLNINGGSKGIIAVTRTRRSLINICASGRQTAEADMDGQNGRRHDFDITMKKPCTKAQTKAAKRKAKRAAAKAKAGKAKR